ncbi:aminoglycoside 2'-N-acetyltransferase [Streptomyces cellostaticus]|uniref:Aminoglycoside 2'-N-acetyltransferase n=1 Tax=Streptomyces cellostaticus TaxID=67285 RepID=A0A101NH35_9ACTN|nr:GNAT family N-acetyltransferase [Streptomyces cellostaticus]KUM92909.1 aminoglycoside 2'-N-acetyltransferase [Streptomyces cellostaticus]GHI04754.1 aminoglycoside 2'-N-acetyltransferase [Streptomyces cellostaticus]
MTLPLHTAHTADLDPADLRAARALLDEAFDGDFSDQDWDHSLGGMHVLVHDGAGLAAHGSVVMRRIRHRRRWLRTGYVEAVAVRAEARRTGLGGRVMAALEGIIDRAYDLGALSASEDGALLYTARGWQRWGGRVCALSPDGIIHLPEEEGGVHVRPACAGQPLDPGHELVFDWRDGDVV